jgi:AraC-like DNA-binding protein
MDAAHGLSVSATQAMFLLAGLSAAGANTAEVLARAGLTGADLSDPEKRLPREVMVMMWTAAVEVTGDEAFGLHVAERLRPGMFDVIEYLARSSHTLGEAAARAQRYVRLFDDVAQLALEPDGDMITLVPRLGQGLAFPLGVVDCVLAATLMFARQTTGVPLVPVEVTFTHEPPRDIAEYQRIFGSPVRFQAAREGLTFAKEHLALPLVTADPHLSAILDRHASELLRRLPPVDNFVDRVRCMLAEELRGGDPSAERIATRMHMSSRTLRRRLEEQGSGVQPLLDDLRKELALRYLEEARLGLDEIAFELGFADARAFRRAFKRWTGRTPRARKT